MTIQIDYQYRVKDQSDCPDEDHFTLWIQRTCNQVLKQNTEQIELCVVIVNQEAGAQLNFQYRQKPGATNILSFNYLNASTELFPLIGDLVFCRDVILDEATDQNKKVEAHWAHLTVHGMLHLLGYDHQTGPEAKKMEQLEVDILSTLGYNNPYEH